MIEIEHKIRNNMMIIFIKEFYYEISSIYLHLLNRIYMRTDSEVSILTIIPILEITV